ncbi:MAG: T9SS type A sorting domain-containing protein [Bacteroidota bacterium]
MKNIVLISFVFTQVIYCQLTTNLLDNFNRSDNTSVGSTPTSPTSLSWNEVETGVGALQISSNKLVAGSTTSGREWCYVAMSSVSNYPVTLNTSSGIVTWAINLRTTKNDLSGLGTGNYGVAFVLATENVDITTGRGYCVYIGGNGNPDAIRFARYSSGLASAPITLFSGGSLIGNEYLSIKVTYDPTGNNWSLYMESDVNAYPQSDPRNTVTQIGSTTSNSTYTGVTLNYLGVLWNHGTASESCEFDDIYVSDPSGALPVELTSFTSNVNENKVTLNWSTATEVNNYGFEVQRSVVSNQLSANAVPTSRETLNADSWTKIGFVQGAGNSNSPKNYSFTDKPTGGKEFQYRLKQIDFNGAFEYSEIATAILENVSEFKLEQNYPNPFNPMTRISYTLPVRTSVKLRVYDLLAQVIAELVNCIQEAGRYDVIFDGSNFPSGAYFYKLEAGSYIEVKKLLLVK